MSQSTAAALPPAPSDSAASGNEESLAELRHIHSHMNKLLDAHAELAGRVKEVEAALSRHSRAQRLQAALLMPRNDTFTLLQAMECPYVKVSDLLCVLANSLRGAATPSHCLTTTPGQLIAALHALTGIEPVLQVNGSMYIP